MNNKVLQMLEKNVEWIAMGAGGLWILWIVWAFIITPPSIQVGGTGGAKQTPSTIDEYIQTNTREDLDRLMNDPKPHPELKAGEYKPNWVVQSPGPIAAVAVGSDPPLKALMDPKALTPGDMPMVKGLPDLPAPTTLGILAGRSQVNVPPPAVPPVAGGAAPAPAVAPVVPVVLPPRVPLGPGGAPAPGLGVPGVVDKIWVCVSALIDPAAIAKAFNDVGIPEFLQKQMFVYVQLERVEVKADGSLGKPVIIKELPINVFPDDPTDEKQRDNLLKWLEQQPNQTRVLNPGFYQVVGGDLTTPPQPGTAPDAAAAAANVPQPGNPQNFIVDGKFDVAAALAYFKGLGPKEREEFRARLTPAQKGELYQAIQEDEKKGTGTGVRPTPGP
ncbi:MAG: hypothetical protein ACHRHE_13470, partial [Tepidisphaerales bacterium]